MLLPISLLGIAGSSNLAVLVLLLLHAAKENVVGFSERCFFSPKEETLAHWEAGYSLECGPEGSPRFAQMHGNPMRTGTKILAL